MRSADTLLLEIARCRNVSRALESIHHPCSPVVAAQRTTELAELQLPEPWNGQIETAPILFVSWNPSWNPNETFPTSAWADERIISFFRTRFEHTDQASQTWREMQGIATHLLGRTSRPGVDYAVTDAVRCKSQKGIGANAALSECSALYLRRTLAASGARVIVALGRDSRQVVGSYFGVPPQLGAHGPLRKQGRDWTTVLLGAPGSAQPRRLPPDQLLQVQAALA